MSQLRKSYNKEMPPRSQKHKGSQGIVNQRCIFSGTLGLGAFVAKKHFRMDSRVVGTNLILIRFSENIQHISGQLPEYDVQSNSLGNLKVQMTGLSCLILSLP